MSFPRLNLSSHFVFHRAVCVPELGSAKRGGMAKKLKEATEGDRDFIAARTKGASDRVGVSDHFRPCSAAAHVVISAQNCRRYAWNEGSSTISHLLSTAACQARYKDSSTV